MGHESSSGVELISSNSHVEWKIERSSDHAFGWHHRFVRKGRNVIIIQIQKSNEMKLNVKC